MNKKRLILLVIMIIITMLLFSCNKEKDDINSSININQQDESLIELNSLELSENTYVIPISLFTTYSNYDYELWSDYINKEYGISIVIDYYRSSEIKTTKDHLEDGEGLMELRYNDVNSILMYAKENNIIRLNDILEDSVGYNSLPNHIKELYTDSNGDIWALPKNNNLVMSSRIYKKSILDNIKLDAPTNLNDMYEVFVTLKKETNTSGMLYDDSHYYFFIHSFKDIFYANGCYFAGDTMSTIAYYPELGSYENFLLMDNASITLEYITLLLDSQLAEKSNKPIGAGNLLEVLDESNSASVYGWINNYNNIDNIYANYTSVPGLLGSRDNKYIEVTGDESCLVLPTNSNLSDEDIVAFADFIYGTSEGRYAAFYGINDIDYRVANDSVQVLFNTTNNSKFTPFINISELLDNEYIEIIENDKPIVKAKNITGLDYLLNELSINESAVFSQKPLYAGIQSDDNISINTGISEIYTYFTNRDSITISEFIDEYRKNIKVSGVDQYHYNANELLGVDTHYKY